MDGSGISKSQDSRLCEETDGKAQALSKSHSSAILARRVARIVSVAVTTGVSVNAD